MRRAPQPYQLSSEKRSIHYASLSAMFNPLHSISNQELFEKHLYNPRTLKERNGAARPNYINYRLKSEVSILLRCRLCSTHYTAVRIKNCFKSTSAIRIATMKNTDDFCYEGKPSRPAAKLTPFAVRKNEWDSNSLKNVLYVLQYAKRHLSDRSDVGQ